MYDDPLETLDDEITEVTLREVDHSSKPSPFLNAVIMIVTFGLMIGSWEAVRQWAVSKALQPESLENQIVLEDHDNVTPLIESEVVKIETQRTSPQKKSEPKKIMEPPLYNAGGELDLDNPEARKNYQEATASPVFVPAESQTKPEPEAERDDFIPFESE